MRTGLKRDMKVLILLLAFALGFSNVFSATDYTASLEYLYNPSAFRWPSSTGNREILDLQFYQGRLYAGNGEVESNPGPIQIYSYDTYLKEHAFEYEAGTECISSFKIASWGDLYIPSQDMREGHATQGHVYYRNAEGEWGFSKKVPFGKVKQGPTGGSVNYATHIWDMTEYDGRVFTTGYGLAWSTNRFASFVDATPTWTNAYQYLQTPYKNQNGDYASISMLRRQVQYVQYSNALYAVPNTFIFYNFKNVANIGQIEAFKYNESTKLFDEAHQHVNDVYPGLTEADNTLCGSYTGTYGGAYVRMWHTTPFKDKVLYVASLDYSTNDYVYTSYPLPMAGYSSVYNGSKIKATKLNFGKDVFPWDFTVVGDTVYTLTSKFDNTTKISHHTVWKSTDGVNFSEVLSFDFHQYMISLDYNDGYFYFGVGQKNATKSANYTYNSQANEAGAIYRIKCPMEPVSVILSDETMEIDEGASRTVGVKLSAAPSTNVTVNFESRGLYSFTFDKSSITFTPENWNVEQLVEITSVEDASCLEGVSVIHCAVFGNDIERGKYYNKDVTSGVITVSVIDNEEGAVFSGTVDSQPSNIFYKGSLATFGTSTSAEFTSVTMEMKVFDSKTGELVGTDTKVVSSLQEEFTLVVNNTRPGYRYKVEITAFSSESLFSKSFCMIHTNIASPHKYVDQMDDSYNRGETSSNSTNDGTGSLAFDNDITSSVTGKMFGGYRNPTYLIYEFIEPRMIDGIGIMSIVSGDPDRHPKEITVYGGSSTNDFVLLEKITNQTDWEYGEWRRFNVANTNEYSFYKIEIKSSIYWVLAQELELYSLNKQYESSFEITSTQRIRGLPIGVHDLTTPVKWDNDKVSGVKGVSPGGPFDDDTTSKDGRWVFSGNTGNVVYRFDEPTKVNIVGVHNLAKGFNENYYFATARAVKEFEIRGSMNGSDWTSLMTIVGETDWVVGEFRYFAFVNDSAYLYYDFVVKDNNGNDYTQIHELEYFYYEKSVADVVVDITNGDGITESISIPKQWLLDNGLSDTATSDEAITFARSIGTNGYLIWESYVAGLNPQNPNSKFVVNITMNDDGVISISYSPDLGTQRNYEIQGKTFLDDEWQPKNDSHRFFRVKVSI